MLSETDLAWAGGGPNGREATVPISQQQSEELVKDVKQSVAELRALVKDAVSHREKCCTVLSSALAVSLALEQVRSRLCSLIGNPTLLMVKYS